MQISAEKILEKMARELAGARQHPEKMREHVAAVRALCDLILEEQAPPSAVPVPAPMPVTMQPSVPAPVYVKEEGANGGSLLDF